MVRALSSGGARDHLGWAQARRDGVSWGSGAGHTDVPGLKAGIPAIKLVESRAAVIGLPAAGLVCDLLVGAYSR
jgi:hypothetical protein